MLRKCVVCILFLFALIPSIYSQDNSVLDQSLSVRFNDVTIPTALKIITKVTEVNFTYNPKILPITKVRSSYYSATLNEILTDLFELENLFFKEVNGNIVILKRRPTNKIITGQVVDAVTKAPLQYANVFIDNSSFGVATDLDGNFRIENVPNIRAQLVVSFVGYRPKQIPISINDPTNQLSIEMEPNARNLETITIISPKKIKRSKEERKFLKRFKIDFLGRSAYSKDCRILNPYVLNFESLNDSTDGYNVTASDVIEVENKAMGYRISFKLDEFKYENGIVRKKGQSQFTELDPRSRKQNKKWVDARKLAYYGSDIHFLNSLLMDQLQKEGFRVNIVRYDSANFEYTSPLNPPDLSEIFSVESTNHLFQYQLKTKFDIEITYTKEYEIEEYVKLYRTKSKNGNYRYTDQKSRSSIILSDNQKLQSYRETGIDISSVPLYQKTVISFNNRAPIISIPGYFNNVNDVVYLGWWTWGGFSEMLPLNYRPPN